jgi:hypothetical protein
LRAAVEALLYPLQTIPIIRDGINAGITGYDYQFTPAQAAIEAPIRLSRAAERTSSHCLDNGDVGSRGEKHGSA